MLHKVFAVTLCLFFSVPAYAQELQVFCFESRQKALDAFAHMKMSRQAMGLDTGGNIVEFFGNNETGSFDTTITSPDGKMCSMLRGGEWYFQPTPPLPSGKNV